MIYAPESFVKIPVAAVSAFNVVTSILMLLAPCCVQELHGASALICLTVHSACLLWDSSSKVVCRHDLRFPGHEGPRADLLWLQ